MKTSVLKVGVLIITSMLINVSFYAKSLAGHFTMLDQEFEVRVDDNEAIFIDGPFIEGFLVTEPKIILSVNDNDRFVNDLSVIRNKYTEWNKTAIENNVLELTKVFPNALDGIPVILSWKAGDESLESDKQSNLIPMFVISEGKTAIVIGIGSQRAATNEFFTVDAGVLLMFQSLTELDSLVNTLLPSNIQSVLDNQKAKEQLFH